MNKLEDFALLCVIKSKIHLWVTSLRLFLLGRQVATRLADWLRNHYDPSEGLDLEAFRSDFMHFLLCCSPCNAMNPTKFGLTRQDVEPLVEVAWEISQNMAREVMLPVQNELSELQGLDELLKFEDFMNMNGQDEVWFSCFKNWSSS